MKWKSEKLQDETHYLHRQDGGPNLGSQAAALANREDVMLPPFFMSKRFLGKVVWDFFG